MMKGFKILGLFFLILWTNVFSQQLSHQVLVPLAGLYSDGRISYSQTIGETAVEIVSCSDYIFTQGFQQPLIKVSSETPPEGSGIKIYPNPVTEFVTIELYGESAKTFRIDFINLSGRVVRSSRVELSNNFWYKEPQNIKDLISGFYLIRIKSEDGKLTRTFMIEKI